MRCTFASILLFAALAQAVPVPHHRHPGRPNRFHRPNRPTRTSTVGPVSTPAVPVPPVVEPSNPPAPPAAGTGNTSAPTATATGNTPAAPSGTSTTASLSPAPTGSVRLDLEATAEAQRFDATATRAFTNVEIRTSTGQCLTADQNTGDFRQNLMSITETPCNGVSNQLFDFITKGVHNDQPGKTLIVSSAFFPCFNFDGRRQPGDRVNLFSCGGRADGDGKVTDSQLFEFEDPTATSINLKPANGNGTICLFVGGNGRLVEGTCNGSANQVFTIGNGAPSVPPPPAETEPASPEPEAPTVPASPPPASETVAPSPPTPPPATSTGTIRLDEAATREAHQRDNGASRAFTAVPIASGNGCLTANLNSGDFRQNLMEVLVSPCVDGLDTQQWDVITEGIHNNVAGQALLVSSLTNACVSHDPRRAPGTQVHLFSCGGRADGSGEVTNSQLFELNGDATDIPLIPGNVNRAKCLTAANGKLDIADCNPASPGNNQVFTIG